MRIPFVTLGCGITPMAVLVFLCTVGPGTAAADSGGELLRELQAAYRSIGAVRAEFSQTAVQPAFGRENTAGGSVAYTKGRMHWSYRYPDPQTYVIKDGQLAWFQTQERQVVEISLDDAFESGAPAVLLGGMANLGQYFRLVTVETRNSEAAVIRLEPSFPDPQVTSLKLRFDRRRGLVTAISTVDAFGNRNDIEFTHMRKVKRLSPDLFDLSTPSGWRRFTP